MVLQPHASAKSELLYPQQIFRHPERSEEPVLSLPKEPLYFAFACFWLQGTPTMIPL
jgi:hypothetical protein